MIYLTKPELRRLLEVTLLHDKLHHLAFVTATFHALRVSELLKIEGADVCDGQLSVRRKKKGRATLQPVHVDADPVFDGSLLLTTAQKNSGRIFDFSRQWLDLLIKEYGLKAGLHRDKLHMHALRHTAAVHLWDATKDLNCVVDTLGHRSPSSSLIYMRYDATIKAQAALNTAFMQAGVGA